MKFKAIAFIVAAAALWLGMAGSAAASPLRSGPAPQVPGARLASGLLPASAFGEGFSVVDRLNTGNALWSTRVLVKPSGQSCANFETYIVVGGYGNTAGATDGVLNRNPDYASYPNIIVDDNQTVLQFSSARAAASFYNQAYSRYKQCSHFTESDPADKSLKLELNTQSLYQTTIGKDKAFQLIQLVDLSALPAVSFYANTAFVLGGANVYTIDDLAGTNDPISASLLGNLISRVQALYKHH